jgi:ubiquinone/menaquinone biosynthesis C-methylase UbiE
LRPLERAAFATSALWFALRDRFIPPDSILSEVDIREGSWVLDYGCGTGSFTFPVAERVGPRGKVYAADVNPLALRRVQRAARRKGLGNIVVIETDCATGLPSETVDVVVLYDTYHDLGNPASVLEELHRVLKPEGILSFSDHHMREEDILREIAGTGRFLLREKGRRTFAFLKAR